MKPVLVIDNDEQNISLVGDILGLKGYILKYARTDTEACQILQNEAPGLILCAYSPPDIKAFALLQKIRKTSGISNTPFILIGESQSPKAFREALSNGANNYLFKPLKCIHLLEAVDLAFNLQKSSKISSSLSTNGTKTLDDLVQSGERLFLQKKEPVYVNESFPSHIYYMVSGMAKISVTVDGDREFILDIIAEGDFFGYTTLLLNKSRDDSAIALEKSEVSIVDGKQFQKFLEDNPDNYNKLLKMIASELDSSVNARKCFAYYSVRKRVALKLLYVAKKINPQKSKPLSLNITRATLAKMAATTTESVIKIINELKKEGHIEESDDQLIIPEPASIENLRG